MQSAPGRKTMKVVLDTNVFVALHKRLRGPELTLLASFLATQPATLVVPEIVFQEAVNRFREQAKKALAKARQSIADLDECLLAPSGCRVDAVDIAAHAQEYAERLGDRLNELRAERPGYSDIPHADLVLRDLTRRRPFRETGKGYRDALIWETVLRHVVEKDVKTILITNDMDFGEGKPATLHADLKRNLLGQGLPYDAVVLSPTLRTFIDEYVKPVLPKAEVVSAAIQDGRYEGFSLKAFFEEHSDEMRNQISDLIENAGSDLYDALPGMPHDIETVSVDGIGEPDDIVISECYQLEDGNVLVQIAVRLVDNELGFFVWKADVYGIPEESRVSINMFDWNEHYSWASVSAQLDVTLELVLDPKDGAVKSWEISQASFVEEWPNE